MGSNPISGIKSFNYLMAIFVKLLHGNLITELKEIELDFSNQIEEQFVIQLDNENQIVFNKDEMFRLLNFFEKFL